MELPGSGRIVKASSLECFEKSRGALGDVSSKVHHPKGTQKVSVHCDRAVGDDRSMTMGGFPPRVREVNSDGVELTGQEESRNERERIAFDDDEVRKPLRAKGRFAGVLLSLLNRDVAGSWVAAAVSDGEDAKASAYLQLQRAAAPKHGIPIGRRGKR